MHLDCKVWPYNGYLGAIFIILKYYVKIYMKSYKKTYIKSYMHCFKYGLEAIWWV